ncbi:MAG: hypothetical protein QOI12_5301 [Alphaproteobacteria bacterium]|jgi:hypothetical protein|nr:hypothetical protein [Alphaproteobacteria bacterium]
MGRSCFYTLWLLACVEKIAECTHWQNMEPRYRKIVAWLQAGVTSAIAIIGSGMIAHLKNLQFEASAATFAVFSVALVMLRFSETASIYLLDNWAWLRKWIFGRHHVEGFWFDVVLEPSETHTSGRQVREYSLIEFVLADGRYSLEGTIFNKDLRRIGTFTTTFASYADRDFKLEYAYDRRSEFDRFVHGTGLGDYVFSSNKPYPLRSTGKFFDPQLDKEIVVRGNRILDTEDIAKLKRAARKPDGQLERLQLELIKKYAQLARELYPEYSVAASSGTLQPTTA